MGVGVTPAWVAFCGPRVCVSSLCGVGVCLWLYGAPGGFYWGLWRLPERLMTGACVRSPFSRLQSWPHVGHGPWCMRARFEGWSGLMPCVVHVAQASLWSTALVPGCPHSLQRSGMVARTCARMRRQLLVEPLR